MTATTERSLGQDPALLRESIALLAPCRYFQTMTPEVLGSVLEGGTLLEAPPDTVLIREGDTDDAFYILLDGELSVRSRGGVILTLQNRGDIIGEMAIISAARRSADVVTDLPSRLVRVSFSVLKADTEHPERVRQLFEVFSHIMAAKLTETSARARLFEETVAAARQLASSQNQLESEIQDKLREITLYSRVIEISHDAVLITDPAGTIQSFNPAAQRLFPALAETREGTPLRMDALAAGFRRGRSADAVPGVFVQEEWSRVGTDDPLVLHVSIIPIGEGDDRTGLAFQCRDITLQKAQKQALERMVAERAREIRSLLDNMDEGILTVRADGRIHPGCSAATARLIGPRPEGAELAERLRLDPAAREQLHSTLALLLDPAVRLDWDDLVRMLPAEYQPEPERWLRARFLPVPAEEGGPPERVMAILHDVTGERALADDVARANARQGRIVTILQDRENFEMFRTDALRLLEEARRELGALQVAKRSQVDGLFRTLHTLKGTGALFGLADFAREAHACEDTLRDLREHRDQPIDATRRNALQAGLDSLERLLGEAWDEVRRLIGEDSAGRNVTLSEERLARICEDALAHVPPDAAPRVRSELERLRRVPAPRLLRRYRSVVESTAGRLGKEVALHIVDAEPCELAPEFFQRVDPAFLHLLRNAVDHGVETADERQAAGKPAQSRIVLSARHQNGRLVFTVADDGRGIDTRRILELGVQRGFVKSEQAATLTQPQILQLLFVPGFSSSREVTDLSGRGVGLDVVKTEVERMGGRVQLATEPGRGTTFRLVYDAAAAASYQTGPAAGG